MANGSRVVGVQARDSTRRTAAPLTGVPPMSPSSLRKPRVLVALAAVAAVILAAWRFFPASPAAADNSVVARVKSGPFHVVVTTTGELRAQKFVQIQGPPN